MLHNLKVDMSVKIRTLGNSVLSLEKKTHRFKTDSLLHSES